MTHAHHFRHRKRTVTGLGPDHSIGPAPAPLGKQHRAIRSCVGGLPAIGDGRVLLPAPVDRTSPESPGSSGCVPGVDKGFARTRTLLVRHMATHE